MASNVPRVKAFFILFFAVVFATVTIVCILVDDSNNAGNGDNVRFMFSPDRMPSVDERLHRTRRDVHRSHVETKLYNRRDEEPRNSDYSKSRRDEDSQACSDFYNYTCSNRSREGFMATVKERNAQRLRAVLSKQYLGDDDDDNVSRFQNLCKKSGGAVDNSVLVQQLLDLIKPQDYDDLAYVWGKLHLYNIVTPLDLVFVVDPWNATRRLPSFLQSGVFEQRLLVFDQSGRGRHFKDISKIAALKGYEKTWVDVVIEVEKALYNAFTGGNSSSGDNDGEDVEDNLLDYLRIHRTDEELVHDWRYLVSDPRFNVTHFLVGCTPEGVDPTSWIERLFSVPLWCRNQVYLRALPSVILSYTLEAWIMYTRVSVLSVVQRQKSSYLPYPKHYDAFAEFRARDSRFLYREKDMDCGDLVQMYLPEEVNRRYLLQYISDEGLSNAQRISARLKMVYMEILSDKSTKRKIASLDVVLPEYPQGERVGNDLLRAKSFIDAILTIKKTHMQENFMEFYQNTAGPGGDELLVQANAFYQQQLNSVTVGFGLLVEPFFSENMSIAEKYARLGFVLAHEMAHAIDFTGMNFDDHGSYQSRAVNPFSSEMSCLQQEYTIPTNFGNMHNGRTTLNENFADVYGLYVAYRAFLHELGISTRDVDERSREFFLAYAEQFCSEGFPNRQKEYDHIRESLHSLPSMRVNNVILSTNYRSVLQCENDYTSNYKESTVECLNGMLDLD